jgi:hypothetical protein
MHNSHCDQSPHLGWPRSERGYAILNGGRGIALNEVQGRGEGISDGH